MQRLTHVSIAKKGFDSAVIAGFLLPALVAVLIGLAIRAHSRPIQTPMAQTTDSSGSVTATAPVNLPTAAEIAAANAAVLAYCENDLRQDTSCALVLGTDTTAPGFVEAGLKLDGHFATDGNSSQGLALAKGSGDSWVVIWVGQSCIPPDVATQNSVPSSLNICSS